MMAVLTTESRRDGSQETTMRSTMSGQGIFAHEEAVEWHRFSRNIRSHTRTLLVGLRMFAQCQRGP